MNEILLNETIKFGKYKGCKGRELIKTKTGLSYLKWIYETTDIPIEAVIVVTLIANGVFKKGTKRINSRFLQGGTNTESFRGVNQNEIYQAQECFYKPNFSSIKEGRYMANKIRETLRDS